MNGDYEVLVAGPRRSAQVLVTVASALFAAALLAAHALRSCWRACRLRPQGVAAPPPDDDRRWACDRDLDVMYTRERVVTLQRVPWDGDSLFAAAALQLWRNSRVGEMGGRVARLRKRTVRQLRAHLPRYRDLLLETVAQRADRYGALPTEDERVCSYLRDLACPGCWPGLESVAALADALGVAVTVFVERQGEQTLPEDLDDVAEELQLAMQPVRTKEGHLVAHFDSVVRAEPLPGCP
ncbi:uncharacterized protein LOC134540495 isoform X2 [Bacillus rossius redtenbacheri]|uniref:uncharacterized protein LOC134540495 isoform X2 n=1 Tax=Bacillus rossius redtenbacheri TaxID=93214 RepID=UPI002FDDBBF3